MARWRTGGDLGGTGTAIAMAGLLVIGCACPLATSSSAKSGPTRLPEPVLPTKALHDVAEYCLAHVRAGLDSYQRFAYSFSAEQKKRMAGGQRIPWAELSAKQRKLYADYVSGYRRHARLASSVYSLRDAQDVKIFEQAVGRAHFTIGGWQGGSPIIRAKQSLPYPPPVIKPPTGQPVEAPPVSSFPQDASASIKAYANACGGFEQQLLRQWEASLSKAQRQRVGSRGGLSAKDLTASQRKLAARRLACNTWRSIAHSLAASLDGYTRQKYDPTKDMQRCQFLVRPLGAGVELSENPVATAPRRQ